jgi:spore germination protein
MLRRPGAILIAFALFVAACAPAARSESALTPAASSVASSTAVLQLSAAVVPLPAPLEGTPASSPRSAASLTAPLMTRLPIPTQTTFSPPIAIPTARTLVTGSSHTTFGYYVPYDPTSWWSFQAQVDQLSFVAPQWVFLDSCGNLSSRDDRTLVAFAHAHGVKVVPTLPTSSGWLNHQILTDPTTAERAIDQSVAYVASEGYDGLDLDFEGVPPEDRAALTRFATRLSNALHAEGKLFTMALPAKTFDATTGWAGADDYAALAPLVDRAIIMTYEYSGATTPPGSTAPQAWVDRVLAYTTSVIPPEKVLLGVAFYGRDWNLTQGGWSRAVTYPQAAAIAQAAGTTIASDPITRSGTFSYSVPDGQGPPLLPAVPGFTHDIVEHLAPACRVPPPATTPPPTFSPTPSPVAGGPVKHEVWIENASSVRARLDLADTYQIAGVAFWRLGQEDPAAWTTISTWRDR